MKKFICFLLIFALLLPVYGCSANDPETSDSASGGASRENYPYTTYEKPTFTPGSLQSDLLTVENGNYDRASRTANGNFLEIGSGYFFLDGSLLRYADLDNLTNWFPACDDPECNHGFTASCSAQTGQVYLREDGRLYFLASGEVFDYLALGQAGKGNYMVISMDTSGNSLKLEHIWQDANLGINGRISSGQFSYSGYVLTYIDFEPDGSTSGRIYVVDTALGQVEPTGIGTPRYVRNVYSIFGDTAYITEGIYMWIQDGELVQATLPELPLIGGHWSGSTVRFYRTNDGYYDYDLLTGEETRIADAQVDDTAAWIIEPNCILETTLFESSDADERASVRTHIMKLFDGQTWHDVTLPEDIASGRTRVEFQALTSDSIILRTPDGGSSNVTFYRIAPEQETYTLEQIGQFTAE